MIRGKYHIYILFACLYAAMGVGSTQAMTIHENIRRYILPPAFYTKADTARITLLIDKGNELIWSHPDSAISAFRMAEERSRVAGYINGSIEALIALSHVYSGQGKYAQSFYCYNKAAIYCYFNKDKSKLSRLYTDMATTYLIQSDYPHAAHYYFAAFKVLKENGLGEHMSILYTYANLAYLQSKMGQYKSALYYLDQAQALAIKKDFHGPQAFILNNKGEVYRALKQPQKALACYTEGLRQSSLDTVFPANRRMEIRQSLYISIATLLLEQNDPKGAISYVNEGLNLSNTTNPYYSIIFPNYLLGKAWYQLGEYKKAEACLAPALQKAKELKFTEDMPDAIKTLSAVYEATGKDHKALQQYRDYAALNDSLLSQEKMQDVEQAEIKYRTLAKDKELGKKQLLILSQHAELMQKNTWLLVFSLCLLALFVIVLLLLMRFRNNLNQRRLQEEKIGNIAREMEIVKKAGEIKVMQALMKGEEQERERIAKELHDGVGGMLAAVQMHFSTIGKGDDSQQRIQYITRMLDDTATEIRKTAYNLMPDAILQYSLERALELFFANVNVAGALLIDLQIHGTIGAIEKSKELYIYRIIQELVQNIIRHSGACSATIQLIRQDGLLLIIAEDNGVGFDQQQNKKGLGLQNIRSRVAALGGDFTINSAPGKGTTSYIEFPLPVLITHSA